MVTRKDIGSVIAKLLKTHWRGCEISVYIHANVKSILWQMNNNGQLINNNRLCRQLMNNNRLCVSVYVNATFETSLF